jgi:hypothetical protein
MQNEYSFLNTNIYESSFTDFHLSKTIFSNIDKSLYLNINQHILTLGTVVIVNI